MYKGMTVVGLFPAIILSMMLCALPAAARPFGDAKLLPGDGDSGDRFGESVSVSDGIAVAGAPRDDDNGHESGSAYVFRLHPLFGNWYQEFKLLPADGDAGNTFGESVAVCGDLILVGAPRDDDNGDKSGSAYVFRYDPDSESWLQETKLLPGDGVADARFGWSVALRGDVALVGAPSDDDNGVDSGSAYVFRYDPGSESWLEEDKLVPADGAPDHYFGISVALSNDTGTDGNAALVGSYLDTGNGTVCGSAYVFRFDPGTETWSEEAELYPADGETEDYFGWSVAISADTALIGAPYDGDAGYRSGSAFAFRRDPGTGTWQEEAKLLPAAGAAEDGFGISVSLDCGDALIGAPWSDGADDDTGSAYLFRHDFGTANWEEIVTLRAADAQADDYFGWAVALGGDIALIGAYYDDAGAFNAGAAYAIDTSRPVANQVFSRGAARVVNLQADITEDNAGNGFTDIDPDDGGWDWIINKNATEHSSDPSPTNLHGLIGLALYQTRMRSGSGMGSRIPLSRLYGGSFSSGSQQAGPPAIHEWIPDRVSIACHDVAMACEADPEISAAPTFIFLICLDQYDPYSGLGYAALARTRYDAKIADHGSALLLAETIRDFRGGIHQDGFIAYDLYWFAEAALWLDEAFPGEGYDTDALVFAQVIADDIHNPSGFFDPYNPQEFAWTIGLACGAAAFHRTGIEPELTADMYENMMTMQKSGGAFKWSVNYPAANHQATAYAVLALSLTGGSIHTTAGRAATAWIASKQAANGGWDLGQNEENPTVDAELLFAMTCFPPPVDEEEKSAGKKRGGGDPQRPAPPAACPLE